jgi:hypothetical protein
VRNVRNNCFKKYVVGSVTLSATVLLFSGFTFSLVYAVTPHLANSMWIEPTVKNYDSSTSVGTRFNVTVWLNVTHPTNSWQFYLTYNRTHLQALRCNYTGNGKSLWSGNSTAASVPAMIDFHDASLGYVLHSESIYLGANRTGAGNLSWIEFNITKVPPTGVTITSEMRLDIPGVFSTKALDSDFNLIELSYGKCNYSIPEFPPAILLLASLTSGSATTLVIQRKTQRRKQTSPYAKAKK